MRVKTQQWRWKTQLRRGKTLQRRGKILLTQNTLTGYIEELSSTSRVKASTELSKNQIGRGDNELLITLVPKVL